MAQKVIQPACNGESCTKNIECRDLAKENEELRKELTESQRSCEESKKELEDLRKKQQVTKGWKIKRGKSEKEDTQASMNKEMESLRQQLEDAREESALKKDEFAKILTEKTKSWDQARGDLRQEVSIAKRATIEAEEKRDSVVKELSTVKEELCITKQTTQKMELEIKTLNKTISDLKNALAQLRQKYAGENSSHIVKDIKTCSLGNFKGLQTPAQNGDNFKEHSISTKATDGGPSTTSQTGHQSSYENVQYHFRSGTRAIDDSKSVPSPLLCTISPIPSLPINLQRVAIEAGNGGQSVSVHGDDQFSAACQQSYSDNFSPTIDHENSQGSTLPNKPLQDVFNPSEIPALSSQSPYPPKHGNYSQTEQSLSQGEEIHHSNRKVPEYHTSPIDPDTNTPGIPAKPCLSTNMSTFNAEAQIEADASKGKNIPWSAKRQLYVNQDGNRNAGQVISDDQIQEVSCNDSSKNTPGHLAFRSGTELYCNLPGPDFLYCNLTADFTEKLSNSTEVTKGSHSGQLTASGHYPVPTPRKIKPNS